MSIREIPKSWEYKCDRCGVTHHQENASGHYSNSTPPMWVTIRVSRYSNAPVEILLCDGCEDQLQWFQVVNLEKAKR